MPQGGNFGAGSLPDVVIGGDILYVGRTTTYKDYTCTKFAATADTASFAYTTVGGVAATFNFASKGDTFDMQIDPQQLTANPVDGVFLCYSCDCNEPMTGTTAFDQTGYGGSLTGGTATWATNNGSPFAPVIIGGGGLNN
tara:strand:- start:4730 stop:5149 length:420 start_codon:yes stop_codon:yes gene_type:complete